MGENSKIFDVNQLETKYSRCAHPAISVFYRALNTSEDDAGSKLKLMLESFESTLRYLSLICVSKYQKDKLSKESIETSIVKLIKPSAGDLGALIREIPKLYKSVNPSDRLMHSINEILNTSLPERTYDHLKSLSDIIGYKIPKNSKSVLIVIDTLITFRNNYAHGAAPSKEGLQLRIDLLTSLIDYLFECFYPVLNLDLIDIRKMYESQGKTAYEAIQWNGINNKNQKIEKSAIKFETGHLYIVFENDYYDLFPYCMGLENDLSSLYFLNNITKTKAIFISYTNGKSLEFTVESSIFRSVVDFFDMQQLKDGGKGVAAHMLKFMSEISPDSEKHYDDADVEIAQGNTSTAIEHLKYAVNNSPGFIKAIKKLCRLYEESGDYSLSHEVMNEYIEYHPDPEESIIFDDAIILMKIDEGKAVERLKYLSDEKKNPEAAVILEEIENGVFSDQIRNNDLLESEELEKNVVTILDHTVTNIGRLFPFRFRPWYIYLLAAIISSAPAIIFFRQEKILMMSTSVSITLLWFSVIFSINKIKKLLIISKINFKAFYRIIKTFDETYQEMLIRIFGVYPENVNLIDKKRKKKILKMKWIRSAFILVLSLSITITFYYLSMYKKDLISSSFYIVQLFLFSYCFSYLLTVLYIYNKMLGQFQVDQIPFSLVQHPKLSIRYLSSLSRKITFPILLVYFLFCFTLYIGPIKSNLSFVGPFSIFLLFVLSIYYSTIFKIKNVISQKKWSLISVFSSHFDKPFDDLIKKARKEDMERITELIRIRKFIEKMNSWAEKPSVLVTTSFFYLFFLIATIYGTSNLLTKIIVPKIHDKQTQKTSEISKFDLTREDSYLQFDISNVDDVAAVMWFDKSNLTSRDSAHILNTIEPFLKNKSEFQTNVPNPDDSSGIFACKWISGGTHGEINAKMNLEKDKTIIIIVFNTVYENFLGVGGGKLSYEISVNSETAQILNEIEFIRMNTRAVGYFAQMEFNEEKNQITVKEGLNFENLRFKGIIDKINEKIEETKAIEIK